MIGKRPTNWAGNVTFSSGLVHRPSSVEELQDLVTANRAVRAVGTRHSFNRIADTHGLLVSVDAIDLPVEVDAVAGSVSVGGGTTYAQLARGLDEAGLALLNLGSLPHISVAGACATGTHGSGDTLGSLATAVSSLEMVTGTGELVTLRRDTDGDRFAAAVVGLGALGIVVRMTLDVVPAYDVRQWVFDDLGWDVLTDRLDEVFAAGYSVSVFTRWRGGSAGQVWVKRRTDDPREVAGTLFGARAADGPRHPIAGMPARNCTAQLGEPGRWHDRLPHFRAEFTPSSGRELQSEYLVPRGHAVAAIEALFALRHRIAPALQVGELRTVAADGLWLSPSYQRDVLGVHFTWVDDHATVRPALEAVDAALAPFDARPHWGKLFPTPPSVVRSQYPRLGEFATLTREYDPDGRFRNDFLDRYLP